mmetsp:Transcript_28531/g.72589  ORF Transcript_28531/g.72589 Transcript_28531/m.72589 type:complete len:234 (-) Transcript_28531:50-751(-)
MSNAILNTMVCLSNHALCPSLAPTPASLRTWRGRWCQQQPQQMAFWQCGDGCRGGPAHVGVGGQRALLAGQPLRRVKRVEPLAACLTVHGHQRGQLLRQHAGDHGPMLRARRRQLCLHPLHKLRPAAAAGISGRCLAAASCHLGYTACTWLAGWSLTCCGLCHQHGRKVTCTAAAAAAGWAGCTPAPRGYCRLRDVLVPGARQIAGDSLWQLLAPASVHASGKHGTLWAQIQD